MKSKSFTSLSVRPWTLDDVRFSLKVRNNPELMKWFRQDSPISPLEQLEFIRKDLQNREYGGHVVEADGVPAGLCGVKYTGEFTIGILPEYQHKGVASFAMRFLIKKCPKIWSEVFVGNPALEWFISKHKFKVTGVKERAYYKKELGLLDVVRITHD
jgi:RimJ/RimL family protein N-acetyltransferase